MTTATSRIQSKPSLSAVAVLLSAAQLPTSDLSDAHLDDFFFVGDANAILGVVGVERYGENALLRSLVVAADHRGCGIGGALLEHAEAYARSRGVRSLYLLTTTAEEFFAKHGYVYADRERAPVTIKSTREFSSLCPSSSALMVKTL